MLLASEQKERTNDFFLIFFFFAVKPHVSIFPVASSACNDAVQMSLSVFEVRRVCPAGEIILCVLLLVC